MDQLTKYRAILLFGMPGSGKGTQGAVLGQLPGLNHISSGDIFRKLPKHGQLGQEVVYYTSRGLLVPDDLTIRIIRRHIKILELQEELAPNHNTVVLDGLPRNPMQAGLLDEMIDVIQIFHLRITNMNNARERLAARALRENRLDDINDEVIRRRFHVYQQETARTLQFYDPKLIFDIDACQSPLFVNRDIINRLCEIEDCTYVEIPPAFHSSPA